MVTRLLELFDLYQSVELSWLREMLDSQDLVFQFSTTLIKITSGRGESEERFNAAHLDEKNISGTSVVVVLGEFRGAEVIFPDVDVAFSPKHGNVYMFNAKEVRHCVRPVDKGTRCVVIFYTHATAVYPALENI